MSARRKIRVLATEALKEGSATLGRPWTLWGLAAEDRHGVLIEAVLKSFDRLPIGELIDVEVEARHHERFGTDYMLRLVGETQP